MDRKIKPTRAEKILLGITAAFLCLLAAVQLHSPAADAPEGYTVSTARAAAASEVAPAFPMVNVNTAGEEELTALPGIGPSLAGKIVEYREAHGAFAALEDLINVSGIGEAKLEELRDYAVVD